MAGSTQTPKKKIQRKSNEDLTTNERLIRELSRQSKQDTDGNSMTSNQSDISITELFNPAIHEPETLYHNIQLKLDSMITRDTILQIKLDKYQRKNENLNMFIILTSTILGIYETFRAKIDDINKSEYIDVGVNIIPIFLSGVITCTASVIKLKKYQEKCDNIHLTREKVFLARTNLKTVQEHLLFCANDKELERIRRIYFKTTFDSYCQAQSYLDKYVKGVDFIRYAKQLGYHEQKYANESEHYNSIDIERGLEQDNPDTDNPDTGNDDTNSERFDYNITTPVPAGQSEASDSHAAPRAQESRVEKAQEEAKAAEGEETKAAEGEEATRSAALVGDDDDYDITRPDDIHV